MEPHSLAELGQSLVNWLSVPLTLIVGLVGYNFKKTLARIEALEIEVIKLQLQVAKSEVRIQNIFQQLDQIDQKLDKLIDKMLK